MNVGEKRAGLFSQWEAARNIEAWHLCELSMRDLLDTLDKKSAIYIRLLNLYNTQLSARDRRTIEFNNEYMRERRLTKKLVINQRQEENLRRFWIDLKSDFFEVFREEGQIPFEK